MERFEVKNTLASKRWRKIYASMKVVFWEKVVHNLNETRTLPFRRTILKCRNLGEQRVVRSLQKARVVNAKGRAVTNLPGPSTATIICTDLENWNGTSSRL